MYGAQEGGMNYEIEFTFQGHGRGSVRLSEPLEEVIKLARKSLAPNDADFAKIYDLDDDDKEVWSGSSKRLSLMGH